MIVVLKCEHYWTEVIETQRELVEKSSCWLFTTCFPYAGALLFPGSHAVVFCAILHMIVVMVNKSNGFLWGCNTLSYNTRGREFFCHLICNQTNGMEREHVLGCVWIPINKLAKDKGFYEQRNAKSLDLFLQIKDANNLRKLQVLCL